MGVTRHAQRFVPTDTLLGGGSTGAHDRYFAEAGVTVADENTAPGREPPGPRKLTDIAVRYGIRFWSGG